MLGRPIHRCHRKLCRWVVVRVPLGSHPQPSIIKGPCIQVVLSGNHVSSTRTAPKSEEGQGSPRDLIFNQRDPKWLFGQVFFGGLGYQGQKTTHVQKISGCLALPPKAARPQNHYVPEQVCFFGLCTPGLNKKRFAKKPLRVPFDSSEPLCEDFRF